MLKSRQSRSENSKESSSETLFYNLKWPNSKEASCNLYGYADNSNSTEFCIIKYEFDRIIETFRLIGGNLCL